MLRNVIVLFIWLITGMAVLVAQDSIRIKKSSGDLTLLIEGFDNEQGKAKIALCDSEEDYDTDDSAFQVASLDIKDTKVKYIFRDIPFGDYAIKVYHDEDNDGKLDKNLWGAPSEDYGFSNNARGKFGPPKWEDARFIFDTNNDTMQIEIK